MSDFGVSDSNDSLFNDPFFRDNTLKVLSAPNSARKPLKELSSNNVMNTPNDRRNYFYSKVNEEERKEMKQMNSMKSSNIMKKQLFLSKMVITQQAAEIRQLKKEVAFLKLHNAKPRTLSPTKAPTSTKKIFQNEHLTTPKKRRLEEESDLPNQGENILNSAGKPPLFFSPSKAVRSANVKKNPAEKVLPPQHPFDEIRHDTVTKQPSEHPQTPDPKKKSIKSQEIPSTPTASSPKKSSSILNFQDLEKLLDGLDQLPLQKLQELKRRREGLKSAQTLLMHQKYPHSSPRHPSQSVPPAPASPPMPAASQPPPAPSALSSPPNATSYPEASVSIPRLSPSVLPFSPSSTSSSSTSNRAKFSQHFLSNIVKQHGPVSMSELPAFKEKLSSWKNKYSDHSL
jgi:hypothetical protein